MALFGERIDGERAAELGLAWAAVDDARRGGDRDRARGPCRRRPRAGPPHRGLAPHRPRPARAALERRARAGARLADVVDAPEGARQSSAGGCLARPLGDPVERKRTTFPASTVHSRGVAPLTSASLPLPRAEMLVEDADGVSAVDHLVRVGAEVVSTRLRVATPGARASPRAARPGRGGGQSTSSNSISGSNAPSSRSRRGTVPRRRGARSRRSFDIDETLLEDPPP